MPRYSISNAPTKIDFSYQDPGNFGVEWGIYIYILNTFCKTARQVNELKLNEGASDILL